MKEKLYEISVLGDGIIASNMRLPLAMRFIQIILEEDYFPKQCIYIREMDND